MKQTMADLNSVLFEMIERINDDDLHGDELKEQLAKGRAIKEISQVLIDSASLELKARIFAYDSGEKTSSLLVEDRSEEKTRLRIG